MYKTPFKVIKNTFNNEGYKITYPNEEEYQTFKIKSRKIECICPKGHNWNVLWGNWKAGRRCFECSKINRKNSITLETVIDKFNQRGYEVLDTVDTFKGVSKQKINYKCPNGHTHSINYYDFLNGHRCIYCSGLNKTNKIDVKNELEQEGYVLLSDNIKNSKDKFDFLCPNGHTHSIRLNDWRNGVRCGKCDIKQSYQEKEIVNFLKNNNISVEENVRSIIPPKEIDIYLPDYNIGIEFNGLYWHQENKIGKDYHLKKYKECEEKGIRLISIFEDEWINSNLKVKSRLVHILNLNQDKKVFARKCEIKELTPKEARDFCNQYHIQGYYNSSIKLGLFFKKELVSVMTFCKPSIAKGGRVSSLKIWELSRFCSSIPIIGGASKLFTYFKRNYEWDEIFSYSDNRWNNGNVYKKIGLVFEKETKPNYFYVKTNNCVRYHRFNFRKSLLKTKLDNFDPNLTEVENMYRNNYFRIWDCGHKKFVLRRN